MDVGELIVASEAVAAGTLTRNDLRRRCVKLHRDVYAPRDLELTARHRAEAAWLWSRREAVLVGNSAAAMLGTKWMSANEPAELGRTRYPSSAGIIVRSGVLADDEVLVINGVPCTTPVRTAYDIGRRNLPDNSIIRIDALLNATRCRVDAVATLAERYPGARHIRRLREVLELVDGGAESPQETRLRLLLVRAGLPRPETQSPVRNDRGRVVRRIDLGWPEWKVGAEYDGEQHWNPTIYEDDIDRLEFLAKKGWLIVRVSARHLRYASDAVVARVQNALRARGCPL